MTAYINKFNKYALLVGSCGEFDTVDDAIAHAKGIRSGGGDKDTKLVVYERGANHYGNRVITI